VAKLRAAFDEAFARREPGDVGIEREWDTKGTPIIEKLAQPELDAPALAETRFYRDGRLLAAQALGVPPKRLVVTGVLVRKQPRGAATGWHQHAANPMPSFILDEVTLWMTLEDVTARNGCLTVLPGSHQTPALAHDRDNYIRPAEIERRRIVRCPLKAGGGLLIHTGVAHGSEPNRSARVRRAWTLYCYLRARK